MQRSNLQQFFNKMNPTYSLLRSKTFYTIVAQFVYDTWQLVAPSVNPTYSTILNVVFMSLASYFHLSTAKAFGARN